MNPQDFGSLAHVKRRLSLSPAGFVMGATLVVLFWGLAGAQAGLELEPQVPSTITANGQARQGQDQRCRPVQDVTDQSHVG